MIPLILDIETVPKGEYTPQDYKEKEPTLEGIQPSKAIKDPLKQEAYIAKKYESELQKYNKDFDKHMDADMKAWKRRSLNDKTCQVVSISVKTPGKSVQVFAGPDEHENLIGLLCWLDDLEGAMKDIQWVGHNLAEFDIPILRSKYMSSYWHFDAPYQEMCTAFLKEPYFLPEWCSKYPPKYLPWKNVQESVHLFDFMYHLPSNQATFIDKEGETKTGVSLDIILKHYGLKGKEGVDGSDVYALWCDGDIDTIVEYNKDEVEQMEKLYNRVLGWWK